MLRRSLSIAAPDGLVILERVNRLAAACRRAGILVIHASVVVRADHSNLGTLAEFNPFAKEGILDKGSLSAALHKDLVVDPRDILLDKPRFGAFHGTDLELILRNVASIRSSSAVSPPTSAAKPAPARPPFAIFA